MGKKVFDKINESIINNLRLYSKRKRNNPTYYPQNKTNKNLFLEHLLIFPPKKSNSHK
jgi:hypothetical protein